MNNAVGYLSMVLGTVLVLLSLILVAALYFMSRPMEASLFSFVIACKAQSNTTALMIMMLFTLFFALTIFFFGVLFEYFDLKGHFHARESKMVAAKKQTATFEMAAYLGGAIAAGLIGCVLVASSC